jgi:nicotinate-nucleotide pyrophosphorylase (carboxylating)
MKEVPFAPLDAGLYREIVRRALAEDLGWGDVTTDAIVAPSLRARGVILAKSSCVVAGVDVAAETFRQLDPSVVFTVLKADGMACEPGDLIADVRGSAASMLTAERTALNLMQRMTGIATMTHRFVQATNGGITILDTRKTTPTLRALEKYAVRAGGGTNHRSGLDDGVLIKDNHIRLAGGLEEAVRRMKAADPQMAIEVEAQSLEQVDQAIQSGADIILLDNLSTDQMKEALARIAGRAKVEISGGVTLDRIPELAATGADYVSVGALTHSAAAADLSFELEPDV